MEIKTDIAAKPEPSDDDVVRKSQSDPQAFRSIYEKYYKNLYLFAFRRLGDRELARDITQQVFLKALQAIGKFQFRGVPFSAWLFRIAVNECNEFFRKTNRARLVSVDERMTQALHDELTYDTSADELEAKLPMLLQRLREDELQLIQLRFFDGLPFQDIALILDITENNAKVKTYRALDRLKKHFLNP
ncbi:MAG: RNA polymerase sigma factor [Bacteroidota bacterium]|nr:sigma-70 family RNA polymerase sigma factor [Cytophagales bacterium]MCE2958410.1 sigma-70 family RNA polymerase sigma factor [Flammeovirgaceae bacterium]MCZ8071667.1 sigma-70 family RNA polymerase sigma factor [Cytophagales bacterium]